MTQFIAEQIVDGKILLIELRRPERLNALHASAHVELADAFDRFEASADLMVAVLSGSGKAFCAGNDLKWQAEGGSMARPASGFAGLTLRHARTKPVIAAVNGVALGGGCEIVLACDLAVAAETASFALPEVLRGLVPLSGVHLLPRQIGRKAAMAVLLTGRTFNAAEAMRIGIINEVVPDGEAVETALRWARDLLAASPQAVATCLDIVHRSLSTPDLATAMGAAYDSLDRLRASADFVEGPRAFAERRAPRWTQ